MLDPGAGLEPGAVPDLGACQILGRCWASDWCSILDAPGRREPWVSPGRRRCRRNYDRLMAMISGSHDRDCRVDLTPAVSLFRSLGDPTRLAIVHELAKGERRVVDLTRHLGLAQSTVSAHLALMRESGVVQSRALGTPVALPAQPTRIVHGIDRGREPARGQRQRCRALPAERCLLGRCSAGARCFVESTVGRQALIRRRCRHSPIAKVTTPRDRCPSGWCATPRSRPASADVAAA